MVYRVHNMNGAKRIMSDDAFTLKKWMMSILLFVVVQLGGTIWWASGIDHDVKSVIGAKDAILSVHMQLNSVLTLQEDVSQIRSMHEQLLGTYNALRLDLASREDAEWKAHRREHAFLEHRLQEQTNE